MMTSLTNDSNDGGCDDYDDGHVYTPESETVYRADIWSGSEQPTVSRHRSGTGGQLAPCREVWASLTTCAVHDTL